MPEAEGAQAEAKSREGWANCGFQTSRLRAGRKWKRELRSTITLRSLRPCTLRLKASLLAGDGDC